MSSYSNVTMNPSADIALSGDVNVIADSPVTKLSILTYNVGLLRYRLFGCCEVFANPPFANARLPLIPDALRKTNADIIAIQECYEARHAAFICESLAATYPYTARVNSGDCCFKFHNGLLFLSKFPVEGCFLDRYQKVSALESALATKSSLCVKVSIPGLGKVTFVNMHTTAGGEADPEHPDVDEDREDELKQAVDVCLDATNNDGIAVIVGDLNCGPEASPGNFNYILGNGFRDMYKEAVDAGKLADGPKFTWDPKNYLNEIGPHASCPGQRCDHLLLPRVGMEQWQITKCTVVFTDKIADIGQGKLSTLSDHHGVLFEIEKV